MYKKFILSIVVIFTYLNFGQTSLCAAEVEANDQFIKSVSDLVASQDPLFFLKKDYFSIDKFEFHPDGFGSVVSQEGKSEIKWEINKGWLSADLINPPATMDFQYININGKEFLAKAEISTV